MSGSDAARYGKPKEMFDREAEWSELVAFASDPRPGPALGVVSGRRRQGKTYLLEALTQAMGGFYFAAQEAAEAESLRRLADQLAQHTGAPHPARWRRWEEAVDTLLALGDERPLPVVIDAFPDLVRQSPGLPSVIHSAYRHLHDGPHPNRARLLLCGDTMSVMRRLFGGPSPLHGLTALHLVVRPLDFRDAARLWNLDDPRLALLVHAIVGGTPAYRHDYVCDDAPSGPDDFDAWVCRTILNPRVPLYWEARHLLAEEEPDHWDRALCHSALAAVASGCSTRGEVVEHLGRPVTDVSRTLALLQDCGLLHGEPDAFRPAVHRYRVTEPLLAFDHAVVRPHRQRLEQEAASVVWQQVRSVFHRAVVAPHFAQVCRDWTLAHTAPDTFGAVPATASCGALPTGPAVDVVVRGEAGGRPGALLSVGRARWDEPMDLHHLEDLRHTLNLLSEAGEDIRHARPACYGGAGFTPELQAAQARGEVLLVDPERLYHGQ